MALPDFNDEEWNRRRLEIGGRLTAVAKELLDHSCGAAEMTIPGDGLEVVVRATTPPSKKDAH